VARAQESGAVHKDVVETDLSSLTEEEKLELLNQQSPELLSLIEEYETTSDIAKRYLAPVANALVDLEKKGNEKASMFEWISKKYELYMNYLLNLQFYFVLKATRQPVENHPVIDRLTSLKKLVTEMDKRYAHLDDNVKRLAKILHGGSSIEDVIHLISAADTKSKPKKAKKTQVDSETKKQVRWKLDEEVEVDGSEQKNGEETEGGGVGEKRGVTYEIERNKGLTPNRKKEQRNPRVKNRMRFKKAVHKKKSQLPDARKELQRYGGEIRGIKANLVRSVKLH